MKLSELPDGLRQLLSNDTLFPYQTAIKVNEALEEASNLREFADLVEKKLSDLENATKEIRLAFLRWFWKNESLIGPKKLIKKGIIFDNPKFI